MIKFGGSVVAACLDVSRVESRRVYGENTKCQQRRGLRNNIESILVREIQQNAKSVELDCK